MNGPYDSGLERNDANFAPLTPPHVLGRGRTARVFPERTSVIHGARRYTWKETDERARRLASALAKRGIGPRDTVSIMAPNIPEMYEAHYGVPMTGAVLNALNTRLDAATIAFILNGRLLGAPFAADAVAWWRAGSGNTWQVDRGFLRNFSNFRNTEARLQGHFRGWFDGSNREKDDHNDISPDVLNLRPGETIERSDYWEANVTFGAIDRIAQRDLAAATNRSNIRGDGEFSFTRLRDRPDGTTVIRVSGRVRMRWHEDYDWDEGARTRVPMFFQRGTAAPTVRTIDQGHMRLLERYSTARPFTMESNWRQRVEGTVLVRDGQVVEVQWQWEDVEE